jgi:hypothetical protein
MDTSESERKRINHMIEGEKKEKGRGFLFEKAKYME